MAVIVKSAKANLDATTGMIAPQVSGLIAGELLEAVSACRIHTDGKVYMSDASAADAEANFRGFVARKTRVGEPVTLYGLGTVFKYADGTLTPGASVFMGAADNQLDTVAQAGRAGAIAQAISTSNIVVVAAI
jgi:hypothetical protein